MKSANLFVDRDMYFQWVMDKGWQDFRRRCPILGKLVPSSDTGIIVDGRLLIADCGSRKLIIESRLKRQQEIFCLTISPW